ncbi:MAG: 50S ribosomal protein L17 [Candidatus Taylorbacteria bacterium]|nr:50S ribosomal protein L17 [Candidatus Taylorbacteria bacterium]
MRHHSVKRKFGLEKDQRNALMRSLARNLINESKIRTTLAKAKELRPYIEKLVTKAKSGTGTSRRLVISRLDGEDETKVLFDIIAKKYTDRKGGYTRIIKIAPRKLDAAPMAMIEFV